MNEMFNNRKFMVMILITIFLIAAVSNAMGDNSSKYPDVLGTQLKIKEVAGSTVYNGTWTRRPGTDIFDAQWGGIKDVIEIESVNGNEIVLYRHGNKGRYYGTLSPDGSQVSGTADWYKSDWYWNGTVSGSSNPRNIKGGYWKLTDIEENKSFVDGNGWNVELTTFKEDCIIFYSSCNTGNGTTFYERKFYWTPPPTILIPGQPVTMYIKIANGKVATSFYEGATLYAQMGQYGTGPGGGHISLGSLKIAKEDGEGNSFEKTTKEIVPGYIEPKLQIAIQASGGNSGISAGYIYVYSWVKGTSP